MDEIQKEVYPKICFQERFRHLGNSLGNDLGTDLGPDSGIDLGINLGNDLGNGSGNGLISDFGNGLDHELEFIWITIYLGNNFCNRKKLSLSSDLEGCSNI